MSTEDFRPPVESELPMGATDLPTGQSKFAPGDVDPETPVSEAEKTTLQQQMEQVIDGFRSVLERVDAMERTVSELQAAQGRDSQVYAEHMAASNRALDDLRRSVGPGFNVLGGVDARSVASGLGEAKDDSGWQQQPRPVKDVPQA